ncbi:uncharacterized protein LOC116199467 [Punica granatum]|uniref:Uncharacterized protein LOC116199457 n=1 Tax=Punica granatum TaxID=22663 RepID=A0A6P8CU76_PUNGR|nr:uncharacterized protein LOC116199457 [Punica granatum]XP_031385664.1 uncharacterized protein LOC116199458 [Punica granatum]XP_031385678.1 uncharacterized protein LOC116199467 [Punica granatum]
MGSMNRFCSLMILLVISAALLTLKPVAAQVDFMRCATGIIDKECAHFLRRRVAYNTGLPPPDECCIALVEIGKPCHDAFTQFKLKKHDYVGTKADLLRRSDEVWNECVNVVKFVFPPAEAPDHFY